jgi:hypothetical protein
MNCTSNLNKNITYIHIDIHINNNNNSNKTTAEMVRIKSNKSISNKTGPIIVRGLIFGFLLVCFAYLLLLVNFEMNVEQGPG